MNQSNIRDVFLANESPHLSICVLPPASMGRTSIDDGRSSIPHIQPLIAYLQKVMALFQGRYTPLPRLVLSGKNADVMEVAWESLLVRSIGQ
jgi:hypothetical protein